MSAVNINNELDEACSESDAQANFIQLKNLFLKLLVENCIKKLVMKLN